MLTGLLSSHVPGARNTWNVWVDYILRDKETRGLSKALLVHKTGQVAASSRAGFTLSSTDIGNLRAAFGSLQRIETSADPRRDSGSSTSSDTSGSCSDSGVELSEPVTSSRQPRTIRLQGKTYCVKSLRPQQLVAFNGSKYVIVSRSKEMFVVARCDSKPKCDAAALWLERITAKLREKDY